MRIRFLLLLSLLAGIFSLDAQGIRDAIKADPNMSGTIYTSYKPDLTPQAEPPKGYKPFYISHYGRHGSRWHSHDKLYNTTLGYFTAADSLNALTDLGRDVYERMKKVHADAIGRSGHLSPKGTAEHRGIAERMYANYPEVFSTRKGRDCFVECRSTTVPRCIMSMAAFNERLKELNPDIRIHRECAERYLTYMKNLKNMNAMYKYTKEISENFMDAHVEPDRFVAALFKPQYADTLDRKMVMRNMFRMASIMQDVDYLGISFYDLFTEDELFNLWQCYNVQSYVTFGPSAGYGDSIIRDAKPLLQQIISDADDAIANGGRSAFLRFGHDINVVPLLGLMKIDGKCERIPVEKFEELYKYWADALITPMATNVQFIFYRKPKSDDVIVKVLHNEGVCRLPVETDIFPYYHWKDFREYYLPIATE